MKLNNRTNRNFRKIVLGALLSSLGLALGIVRADFEWVVPAGGWPLQDTIDEGSAVVVDSKSRINVAGSFEGNGTFRPIELSSNLYRDAFVAQYDFEGEIRWVRHLRGERGSIARGIATDNELAVVVTGTFSGKQLLDDEGEILVRNHHLPFFAGGAFVARYSQEGQPLWAKAIIGTEDPHAATGKDVASLPDGTILSVGGFHDRADFGEGWILESEAGGLDGYVASYSHDGDFQWSFAVGGAQVDEITAVATFQKYFYIVGKFREQAHFAPDTEVHGSPDNATLFLAKYSQDAELKWVRTLQQSRGVGDVEDVAVDASGDIVITGSFAKRLIFSGPRASDALALWNPQWQSDVFVAKYNPDGIPLWVRSAGGRRYDQGHSIATDRERNVVVGGTFEDLADFGGRRLQARRGPRLKNLFVAQYDAEGSLNWVTLADAGGQQAPTLRAVATDPNDNAIALTGLFDWTGFFGPYEASVQRAWHDIFVARLNGRGKNYDPFLVLLD